MSRGAVLALLAILPICSCAPKPEVAAPSALALDCSMPFEAQSAKLTAQPHLTPAPHAPGEPYAYYSTDDGHASYLITLKGAPGYPAILMQKAAGGQVVTSGCRYGDVQGYKQLVTYLDGLKTWTRR